MLTPAFPGDGRMPRKVLLPEHSSLSSTLQPAGRDQLSPACYGVRFAGLGIMRVSKSEPISSVCMTFAGRYKTPNAWEEVRILRLNINRPAPFGLKLQRKFSRTCLQHRAAQNYSSDQEGLFSARKRYRARQQKQVESRGHHLGSGVSN